MNLAVLFWFYKEPKICENRLQLIKKHNPNLKIFGLFGGSPSDGHIYQNELGKYLDDFYAFSEEKDEYWKWINGDLVILDWYEKRGKNLKWDSIAVAQWDMLVFDSFREQFKDMKKYEIFFSGLRKIDQELEHSWNWIKEQGRDRNNYLNFLAYVKSEYGYQNTPLACLFILEVFPKIFFDKYLTVKNKEIGMLEYKIPIYADIFDIPFFRKDLGVIWFEDEIRPLNAIPEEIPRIYIKKELEKDDGWRIFHPYFEVWPIDQ